MYKRVLFVSLFLMTFNLSHGQNNANVLWAAKTPFEQKVFIENKGQYSTNNKIDSQNILFSAQQGGLQYYFTANNIWIKKSVAIKRTEQEIEELKDKLGESKKNDDGDAEKESEYKQVDEYHQISFAGANSATELTTDNEVSWYYNFTVDGNVPVKAHAFKKLIYRNLYPGIDMEFYFPEDKQGFEYSFIVHPGADITQIKIEYPLNEGMQFTGDKNVTVKSLFGSFTDHKPIATQQGKIVDCSFLINNSIVGFNINSYDKSKDLIIDPWTITPTFKGANNAYDVDWDHAGNCYIYGGSPPFQLIKYNSIGTMLWSYTESFSFPATASDYGGFAVDRNSQSAYMVEGFDDSTGAQVIKVNASGVQVAMFAGNKKFNEMWRIAFNRCTNQAVIAGGGTSAAYQASYLDTTLTNLLPVDILNTTDESHDMWGITFDNYGNCYTAAALPVFGGSLGNVLVKFPLPSLAPTTWIVNNGYNFQEASSVRYHAFDANERWPIGFNGMAMSDTELYTYDSYTLKKWNSATGAITGSVKVYATNDSSAMYWGGLASDDLGNIFLGDVKHVQQYNSELSLIDTFSLPDTVCDVVLGDNGILYTCGKNFVETIRVFPTTPPFKTAVQVISPTCNNPYGSAVITLSGGMPPYSVVWNTTPVQTRDTAINLIPGKYVATITESASVFGCNSITIYDTVYIKPPGSPTFDTVSTCYGDTVTLTDVQDDNSYSWSSSTGLSSTTGSSVAANPTVTSNYMVIGTSNNGCFDTVHYHVIVNPLPVLKVAPNVPAVCNDMSVIIRVSGASLYLWTPSTGLNSYMDSVVIADPSVTTTYMITGMGTNGCRDSTAVVVYVGVTPTVSFTTEQADHCQPQNILFINSSSGAANYSWSFGDGTTSTEVTPLHTYSKQGNYTITLVATSGSGCSDSISMQQDVTIGSDDVFVPTAFTPDVDGENDYFFPNVLCTGVTNYIFRIYNRWGEMLYESIEPNQQGWDGSYKGIKQPMGTYVYYLEMNCDDCRYFKKGDMILIR